MTRFPLLYTERLMLRQLTPDDIPDLLFHVNNKNITDRILNFPFPYEEYHAVFRLRYVNEGFQKASHYVFAIIYRADENEKFVGEISLHLRGSKHAEMGYWIGERYWNMGIATEAIAAVVSFAKQQLKLQSIYAECNKDNPGSQAVLIKNNFQQENNDNEIVRYTYSVTS